MEPDALIPQTLLEMVQAALGEGDFEEGCKRVTHKVAELFRLRGVVLFLCDLSERSLFPVAVVARNASPPLVEERIAFRMSKEGAFYRALSSVVPVYLESVTGLGSESAECLLRVRPICLVPLRYDSKPLGLLVLSYNDAASRPRNEHLMQISGHIGWGLGRAAEFRGLKRSEEKYRALTEDASDIVFALDAVGRFTYLNSRVKEVLGYEPEELLGCFISSMLSPTSWEEASTTLRRAISEGKKRVFYPWEIRTRWGETVVLDVHSSIVEDGSRYIGQQGIARDNMEIQRMEEELLRSKRTQLALKDYIALVTRVQEEERRRIARDLHDDTVQYLSAISRGLDLCLDQGDREGLARRASEIRGMADLAIENLRRFIRDLRPAVLDDLGLRAALEGLVAEVKKRGLKASLQVTGVERRLNPDTELALFRVAQESLNNALAHSSCKSVEVALNFGDSFVVSVCDDGTGFEVPADVSILSGSGRLGLVGMRERIESVGGRFEIRSRPGFGTAIIATVEGDEG